MQLPGRKLEMNLHKLLAQAQRQQQQQNTRLLPKLVKRGAFKKLLLVRGETTLALARYTCSDPRPVTDLATAFRQLPRYVDPASVRCLRKLKYAPPLLLLLLQKQAALRCVCTQGCGQRACEAGGGGSEGETWKCS